MTGFKNLGAPNLTPDDIEVSLDCAHIIPHFLGEESTVERDVEFLIIELIFRNLTREPLGLCSINSAGDLFIPSCSAQVLIRYRTLLYLKRIIMLLLGGCASGLRNVQYYLLGTN